MPSKAKRLYDIAHRHQLYLEGLKEFQLQEFAADMLEMEAEVRALVVGLPYEELDGLTRRQLNAFITALSKLQNGYLRAYVRKLYGFLRDYIEIDGTLYNEVIAEETEQELVPFPLTPTQFMNAMLEQPMTATGQLAGDFVAAYILGNVNSVANEVRRIVANHGTAAELIATLVGTNTNAYKDGLFNRLINQGNTTIRTLMQQVFTGVADNIFKLYTKRYMWSSIIDSVTTDICRSRNGKLYVYDEGPMPPAHFNCRSVTVPVTQGATYKGADDFGAWIEDQSDDFWQDIMPKPLYNALREQRLTTRDLTRLEKTKPITLVQHH